MSDAQPTQYLPMTGSEVAMIRWLFTFNDWTRPQVIDAVGQLSEEQLRQPGAVAGGLGDGSVLASLVHLVDVEESWLARWMGTKEDPGPDPVKYGTLESTANQWEIVDQTRDAWLATLTGADLAKPFRSYTGADGKTTTVPLWPALFHVLIHTSHHRGEIYEALTRLGSPPQIEPDLLDFGTLQAGVKLPFTSKVIV
jgi:uncharacterized damage-inducible protein DinB